VLSRVLCLARRAYDFVVVDTFPLFDRNVMAVLDHTDEVFVVLENVVPTVLGIQKFLKLLESLGVTAARQRLVLNRYARRYGGLLPQDAEEHLKRKLDYVIPAANLGRPFVLSGARFSPALREIQRLAEEIERRRSAPVAHAFPQRPGGHASGNGVASAREIAGATGDHSNR
jgi:pilus assembly protein CpaE